MTPIQVLVAAATTAGTLLVSPLYSAGLYGVVTDPTGVAVPNAEVLAFLQGTTQRWSTKTTAEGRYRFERLPNGHYILDVESSGLALSETPALKLDEAQDQEVGLRLTPQSIQSRVIVTATGGAQPEHKVARAVDVLPDESLQDRAEFSLGDALSILPGLRVQTQGGFGALTRITVRGLRTADTAVTVDGFRFRDAATTQGDATPFLETLTVVNSDRIELLRGTGSSVYGSNAIGGVINIVSDTGGGPLRGSVLAEGGGLGMVRGVARASGGSRHDSIHWSVGAQHVNVRDGVEDRAPARNSALQAAGQWQAFRGATLSGRIWGADAYSALSETPYTAPAAMLPARGLIPARPLSIETQALIEAGHPFEFGSANFVPSLADPDYRRDSRFLAGAVRFHHQLDARASWTASYSRVDTRRRFADGPGGVRFEPFGSVFDTIRGSTDTVQLRTDLVLTRSTLASAGYEWERENYFSRSREDQAGQSIELSRTSAAQRNHNVFAQVQQSLLDNRLQVGISGRVQGFRTHAPAFSGGIPAYASTKTYSPPAAWTGDVAVSYFHFETGTKVRGHAGNGYRAPSLYERWGAIYFEGSFSAFGDPRLKPDRSVAFDWGIDQYFANQKLRLSATHFYTDLREQIAFDFTGFLNPGTDPFGRSSGYINTDGGISRGVELSAEAEPLRRLSVVANYTYVNSDHRRSTVRDNDFFRTPLVPVHQFNGVTTPRITRRLDTVVDFLVTSEIAGIFSSRVFVFDGARRADAGFNYRLPLAGDREVRLYVKANNVLGNRYLENGYRTPGRWVVGGIHFPF
jgi:iron complex outermembrane receptor protein